MRVGCGDGVRGEGDWPVMEARSRHRGTIPAYLRGMRGACGEWCREAGGLADGSCLTGVCCWLSGCSGFVW